MGHVTNTPATIVVVDEQATFLGLAEQALLEAGHRVLVTSEPQEVLELAILYLSALRMPFSLDAMVEEVTRMLATASRESRPGRLRAARLD